MSKKLTEQWRNGKLPENWYYIHLKPNWGSIDCITINYCDEDGVFEEYPDEDIKEVLASVPTYDEYNKSVEKMHILEKKLEIAIKALKEYSDESSWVDCKTVDDDFEYIERKCAWYTDGYETAQKALKEMEEK